MSGVSGIDWQSLSKLLDTALELDDLERAAWLAELERTGPALAAELKRVLAVREEERFPEFLEGPSPVAAGDVASASLIGRQVGPYVVDAELGRGGMGSVWRAHRADGRYEGVVAIKFVHAAWIGQSGEQRFRVEGSALGRLDHPNIARLLDAGVIDATQPYLVLEYVEGEPIDSYCDRLRFGVEGRVRLFLDVLAAVSHAHSQLIVHRDIKPANVFVTAAGTVKLLDFGIAKLLGPETGPAPLTRSGAAALTPQYASPEQLLGRPVTTATDVYGAGLLLYVLLTGRHPVPADLASSAEIVRAVLVQDAPRASTAAAKGTVWRRSLQGDLDNILSKALKKDPAERYASASAFAEDLKRYLTHQPVQARPDTVTYRVTKFVRRHRGGVAASVLTLIAIAAGIAGTVSQARRAEANAATAAAARERALQQLTYADATKEFLSFLLGQGSEKPLTTPELLARGERLVGGQFADDPALRGQLLLTLGNLYGEVQEIEKAERLLTQAQALVRPVADESLKVEIDCALALVLGAKQALDPALALLDPAIQRARADPSVDAGVRAGCLVNRSQIKYYRGDTAASLMDAREALATLGTPRPGQRALAVDALTALADAHGALGEHALAVKEYEQALDGLTRMGRGQTSMAVTFLNGMAVELSQAGQWQRAAAAYLQTIAIERAGSGSGEIRPASETNYAKLLIDLGRPRDALPIFDGALQAARHRRESRAIMMLELLSAPAFCALGDPGECARRLAHAGERLHATLPPGHVILGTYETERAQLAIARGDFGGAREDLKAALKIFTAATERHPNELRALALLAETDLRLGDTTAAVADAAAAVARARMELHGFETSAWLGNALVVQAKALRAQGDGPGARAALGQAVAALSSTVGEDAPSTVAARALFERP